MREIIFRGKHKYSNGEIDEWRYGSLSVMDNGGHTFIIDHKADCIIEVDPSTVGQYTGLEDCTGVMRIYEGDVLREPAYGDTVTVEWKRGGFVIKYGNGDEAALANMHEYCKVIGNIHDGVKG